MKIWQNDCISISWILQLPTDDFSEKKSLPAGAKARSWSDLASNAKNKTTQMTDEQLLVTRW